jgi:Fe-S cluster assembly protein SufD
MNESPQIVVRTRRSEPAAQKDFTFTPEMIRLAGQSAFVAEYRQKAWEIFKNNPLPTLAEEAWRRTDLRPMHPETFHLAGKNAFLDLSPVPDTLLEPLTGGTHGGEIILLPGSAQVKVAPELARQGVVFTNLLTAEQDHPALLEKIVGKVVPVNEGKFAGLAGALAQDGVLLYVPRGVHLEQPLHSLLWGPGAGLAYVTHILVYLEEGASATYVHESASPTETGGQSFHSGLVEIYVGPGASLHFVELQSWGEHMNAPKLTGMAAWIGFLGRSAAT